MSYAEPIIRLIQEFSRLPGIGEKTAERLTFHLLAQPREEALRLRPRPQGESPQLFDVL